MAPLSNDIKVVQRGCTNRDIRETLVSALKGGVRYRMTKKGIILYGEDGQSTATHFTSSDHRAVLNIKAQLRRMGIEPSKKQK